MSVYCNKLFSFLEESCMAEGGDGDSSYIGRDYRKMADLFSKWIVENDRGFWKRKDNDNQILFSDGQQTIWFAETEEFIPPFPMAMIKSTF